MSARLFPILGDFGQRVKEGIPWAVMAPHEPQAVRNHGQSLEQIAAGGGLSWFEALLVLEGRAWRRQSADPQSKAKVLALCTGAGHTVALPPSAADLVEAVLQPLMGTALSVSTARAVCKALRRSGHLRERADAG